MDALTDLLGEGRTVDLQPAMGGALIDVLERRLRARHPAASG